MWQPQGIFNEYILRSPVILTGEESVLGLYNYPVTRVAVIHGSTFTDQDLLIKTFKKKEIKFFLRSWKGEPDLGAIYDTLHDIELYAPDTIIAVGGGSVIDGAKLCRLFYEVPYYVPGITKIDDEIITTKFIAVPTTIGSGAEVSSAAVYVEGSHKEMIVHHELQPDVVVYDKRYVTDTPDRLFYACAMDAMAHIVEGYISIIHNPMIEIEAVAALGLLRVELEKYLNETEVDHMRLQYAGFVGGMVQNHCLVGADHAVSHQLASFGFSHGESIALLLPAVIKMNSKDENIRSRYISLCKDSGFDGIDSLIRLIENVCMKSGISDQKEKIKRILTEQKDNKEFVECIKKDRAGKGNPVDITDEYVEELIRSI